MSKLGVFSQDQIVRWDNCQKNHGRIQDSMSLADDLIPALVAAEVRPEQVFTPKELRIALPEFRKLSQICERLCECTTGLTASGLLAADDVVDDASLDEWATDHEYERKDV